MNIAPRIVLTALTAIALAACGPIGVAPTSSSHPASLLPAPTGEGEGRLTGAAKLVITAAPTIPPPPTAEPTAAPTTPPPPTVEPTAPPPPTAEPTAEPTAPPPPTAEPTAPLPPTAEPTAEPTAPPLPTVEPTATLPPLFGQQGLSAPARIIIQSIGLDRSLVSVGLDAGNTPVVPDLDVAWYNRSANPGSGENVVVWGHALRFRATASIPAPLERVREASVGDTVTIITSDGTPHNYVVTEQIWATPDQVRYILPTGDERLTIVNCIGDYVVDESGEVVSMTHRLITIAAPVP